MRLKSALHARFLCVWEAHRSYYDSDEAEEDFVSAYTDLSTATMDGQQQQQQPPTPVYVVIRLNPGDKHPSKNVDKEVDKPVNNGTKK